MFCKVQSVTALLLQTLHHVTAKVHHVTTKVQHVTNVHHVTAKVQHVTSPLLRTDHGIMVWLWLYYKSCITNKASVRWLQAAGPGASFDTG